MGKIVIDCTGDGDIFASAGAALSLTYFAPAVAIDLPGSESNGMNGLSWKALRPETIVEATNSAPGTYV